MPKKDSSAGFPSLPKIKGGEEVYNMIMGEIEPELTTENLPKNEKKYAKETEKKTVARAQRYKEAFIEYKKRYTEYKQKQDDEVRAYGRDVMKATENNFAEKDESAMLDLESAISNS